ncbi:hypothetical protein C8Q75DRAFT_237000 [Abortiporus biennis]|nr:hypothetical protein C8Q75DRAFT_237000 [Abortiporus biennis]
MTSASTIDLKSLFGLKPSSPDLQSYINSLASSIPISTTTPEVKSYSDAVYFNYYSLGLSLLFTPINDYKPKTGLKLDELKIEKLALDGLDLYNNPPPKTNTSANSSSKPAPKTTSSLTQTYSSYPVNPLVIELAPLEVKDKEKDKPRPSTFSITPETTGKQFVETLGEPDRKGGGAGPSSGSINIWCEWSKDGLMVEFGGDESRGPQAWERGKDAVWKIISIFPPKS